MKKFISLMLGTVLLLSLCIFSAADDTKTTQVSYDVEEGYTVTIPESVQLSTNGQNETVSLSDVVLEAGKELVVTVASANGYNVINGEASIPYTVTRSDQTVLSNPAFEVLRTDKGTGSETLSFALKPEDIIKGTVVGSYTDSLTFTISTQTAFETGKETITFTVGGTQYTAPAEMTWGAYIVSEYNTAAFTIDSEKICTKDSAPIMNSGEYVTESDQIIENIDYTIFD